MLTLGDVAQRPVSPQEYLKQVGAPVKPKFLVKEIAFQAGLRVATVDRVAHGHDGVREQTAYLGVPRGTTGSDRCN